MTSEDTVSVVWISTHCLESIAISIEGDGATCSGVDDVSGNLGSCYTQCHPGPETSWPHHLEAIATKPLQTLFMNSQPCTFCIEALLGLPLVAVSSASPVGQRRPTSASQAIPQGPVLHDEEAMRCQKVVIMHNNWDVEMPDLALPPRGF